MVSCKIKCETYDHRRRIRRDHHHLRVHPLQNQRACSLKKEKISSIITITIHQPSTHRSFTTPSSSSPLSHNYHHHHRHCLLTCGSEAKLRGFGASELFGGSVRIESNAKCICFGLDLQRNLHVHHHQQRYHSHHRPQLSLAHLVSK